MRGKTGQVCQYPSGRHANAQARVGARADPDRHLTNIGQGNPGLFAATLDEGHELLGMGARVVVVQADEHLGSARQTDADGRRSVDSQNNGVHQLLSPVWSQEMVSRGSDSGDRSTPCQRGPKPSK